MENKKTIAATISGVGIVEAKNDRATFTVSIRAKGETLEATKSQVKEQTAQVLRDLEGKKMPLDGEISSSLSNFRLEHREGGEKYPAGYQTVSTITWTVIVDNTLDDIYQTCLKVDTNASAPSFSVKDREALSEQATKKAAENFHQRLDKECLMLNIKKEKLSILNWDFRYGSAPITSAGVYYGSVHGVTGPTGPQGMAGPVGLIGPAGAVHPMMKLGSIYQELLDTKLDPGTVSVVASVSASYVWNEE